jgi:dolichyl-phosphate-mannose-protein mannosyltransferase
MAIGQLVRAGAAGPVGAPGGTGGRAGLVRGHYLFALVFTAGLALRALAGAGYRPALLYIDSAKYLDGSVATAPQGYQALPRVLEPVGWLAMVAAVQHAFGLAMAVVLYLLLLQRGAPRWTAALAAAPVLLDAYQVQLEQMIMPDVMFETMIAAGLAVLLWRWPPACWSRCPRWCCWPARTRSSSPGGISCRPWCCCRWPACSG